MANLEKAFNEQDLRNLIADLMGISRSLVFRSNSQVNTTNIQLYATLQQVTSTPQGSRVYQDDINEIEYAKVTSNVLYSIQIVGKSALLWANRLQPTFRLSVAINRLKSLRIGILQITSVNDLSGAYDSGYEERAQFNLLVSQDTIVREKLNNILTAEIDTRFER